MHCSPFCTPSSKILPACHGHVPCVPWNHFFQLLRFDILLKHKSSVEKAAFCTLEARVFSRKDSLWYMRHDMGLEKKSARSLSCLDGESDLA